MKTFVRFFVLLAFLLPAIALQAQPVITLRSTMYVQDSSATDVWGYFDANTNREYALVGSWNAVSIIDVTDPDAPFYVAFMDSVDGFDIKVWDHYFYAVNGNANGMANVVDIADPTNPVVVGQFPNAHNIWIDEDGFLEAAYPQLTIYDLNIIPEQPQFVWGDTTGVGHDVLVIGDTMYFYEGYNGFWIYEISDHSNPVLMSQTIDPAVSYAHSGFPTKDRHYMLLCDELAQHPTPDITVWDISNLQNITKVDQYADSTAIVHNTFIIGNYAYTSYYMQGFRIFDIRDPYNIELVANYETFPDTSYEAYGGDFGIYPYAPSGNIYCSDMTYGLFVFSVDTSVVSNGENVNVAPLKLRSFPNPMVNQQTVVVTAEKPGDVAFRLLDVQGRVLKQWTEKAAKIGENNFEWQQEGLATGIYSLQVHSDGKNAVLKVVIVKE